jgi:signal peptidase I
MRELRGSAADDLPAGLQERDGALAPGPASAGRRAWDWTRSLLIVFGLFLVTRAFLVEAFRIPTGSMESTLLVGDFLLVNKAAFGAAIPRTAIRLPALSHPRRGEIVVFVPPHDRGRTYVKRVAGVPGDTLTMLDRTLYVNGLPVDEPFTRYNDLRDSHSPGMMWQCEHTLRTGDCRPTRDSWGPVAVPVGHFFLLGDNRDDSQDSRHWGFVPRAGVRGRPLLIYYSYDRRAHGAVPWLTGIRWDRVGHRVH